MNLPIYLISNSYRSSIINDSLSEHARDSLCAAVAPLCSGLHYAGGSPAGLFECGETSRDIELEVKAAAAIATLDHNYDRLLVLTGLSQHLKKIGG